MRSSTTIRIVGIDPGSVVTGVGIIELAGTDPRMLHYEALKTPKNSLHGDRLLHIGSQLQDCFKKYSPNIAVIEKVFFGKNAQSAFKLGQARGVCIYISRLYGLEIAEYTPREVKQYITGSGAADKDQVLQVLVKLLGINGDQPYDASDALALAYHHACHWHLRQRLLKFESDLDKEL